MEKPASELTSNDRAFMLAMLSLTGKLEELTEAEIEAIARKPESEWPEGLKEKAFPKSAEEEDEEEMRDWDEEIAAMEAEEDEEE